MGKIKSEQLAFLFLQTLIISVCWDPVDASPYSKTLYWMLLPFFPSIFLRGQFPTAAHRCAVLLNETSKCLSSGCEAPVSIPPYAFSQPAAPQPHSGTLRPSCYLILEG